MNSNELMPSQNPPTDRLALRTTDLRANSDGVDASGKYWSGEYWSFADEDSE
jgi:hypothetical protein